MVGSEFHGAAVRTKIQSRAHGHQTECCRAGQPIRISEIDGKHRRQPDGHQANEERMLKHASCPRPLADLRDSDAGNARELEGDYDPE